MSAYRAYEQVVRAAQKALHYIADGAQLKILRAAVNRLTDCDASDLVNAKRVLAEAVSENEKYLF